MQFEGNAYFIVAKLTSKTCSFTSGNLMVPPNVEFTVLTDLKFPARRYFMQTSQGWAEKSWSVIEGFLSWRCNDANTPYSSLGEFILAQACGVSAVDCWQWCSGHYFHMSFLFFPVFFTPFFPFPPSRPFLLEGVLGSKNLFCESCLERPKT